MANIIGGNGTGTLDTSLYQLGNTGTTGSGTAGDNEQISINVSDGNLVISHLDEYLPSETDNFLTTRTYNSQGQFNTPDGEGWTLSEFSRLSVITPTQIVVLNSDGSQFTFNYVPSLGVYRTVDGAGAYETISFNARAGTYSLTQSNQTVLTYDLSGRLLQSQDTNGNTISYNYNLFGQLTSIADNSGHKLTFVYNIGGQLTQIHDETGTVFASYQYVGNELVSMTDRAGQTTRYAYNLDGTLRSMTLPSTPGEGTRTLSFTYVQGPNGPMVSSFTDAQGNVTRFNYNFNVTIFGIQGGTTTVTNAAGNVTSYTFNSQNEITDVRDALGNDTIYRYDANQNLTSTTNADGSAIIRSNSTYYRNLRQSFGIVDSTGQGKLVSQLTLADIAALQAHFTTTYTYDGNGNLTSTLDATGNLTTYTYTSFNKLASSTSAEGNALVTSDAPQYLAKRQELGYINPTTGLADTVAQLTAAQKQAILALYTTHYTYDAHQNLTQVQAAGGDLTRFTYDSFGNLTTKTVYLNSSNLTDPSQQETTQYFYDGFGNNIKTIDAQGNTTLATFDHFGNKLTQVDGNGGVTTYQYDAENRLTTSTDPLGNTTFNFYDAVGNRTAVEDAAGHTITYLYSADNQLITVIDPALTQGATRTRTTSYTYDVMGNRTRTTDANGNTTTYSYDALNRQVTTTTPVVTDASGNPVTYTTSYAYDAVGNRITVIDNNGNQTNTVYNPDNLVSSVIDASGNITQFAYDADLNQVSIVVGAQLASTAREVLKFDYDQKDRLISQTDALGNTTHYSYDGANNRVAVTDANGNTTNYTYDRDNRLVTVTQPAVTNPTTGQSVRYTTQYQYDANGNQVAVTDQDGHTTLTTFDKDNRTVLVRDPNGIQTVYTYDSRGNRTTVQIGVQAHVSPTGTVVVDSTQGGQVTTYQYDEFDELIATTDGLGNTATATYDRDGNITGTTDHLGHTATLTYDALNRVVKMTDALGDQTKIAYDGDGNVVSRTDALGRKTTYAYDSMNRLIDTKDALGVDTHNTYDSFGNLKSSTAASGTTAARTTSYVYDLDNRLTAITDPLANTQTYAYDAVGNRLRVTDAKGQTTRYVYDALNRNIAVIDPLGFQTQMTYDGVGNRLSLIDAKGGVTSFTYDAGNREISMRDALGRLTTYTYDVLGDRVTQTTAAGTASQETTTYLYDAQRNLRQVTDAAGNVSTDNYDADYNLTSTTDANGHTTTYAYDALNRQIRVTDATGAVTSYAYDAVGNRLSVTDANGHVTTYTYDAVNRQISSTDAVGVTTTYAYDALGNQVSITYAANTSLAATTKFVYDLDNRLISQTDALGNTQTHQYDADGNVVATTDALGHTTTYAYDADNRVTGITDPLGNVTRYQYDADGNRTQVTDARGFVSTTYYDADNEVVLSVDNDGFATSSAYDANGNVISKTLYATALTLPLNPSVQPTPVASAADRTTLFAYDSLNRIVSRTDGDGFVTQYVYDAVGNRIQTRQALDLGATRFEVTYSYYDADNRQIAAVTAQGYLTTYQYDAVGNRISQTLYRQAISVPTSGVPQPVTGDSGITTTFAFDADNRLIRQTDALGTPTTYQYDARGNRISMTVAAGTPQASTTTYQYDADNRNVGTTDSLGVITRLTLDANGNVVARYDAFGTTQQRVTTYVYDANNRVISQTDPLGFVALTAYDAVGDVVSRTAAAGTATAETTTMSYDGDWRELSSTDATGTVTTYAYDAAGNQVRVTQAAGLPEARTATYLYDQANRLVSTTDALGVVTQYQYDGAGNEILVIEAAGTAQQRRTESVYDLDNRLVQVTDPMGGVTLYQYDAQNNQTQTTDANGGVQVNTFDADGRMLSSTSAGGILTRNAYDLRGNLVSTTQSFVDGSDARTTTYAYDLLNRQVEVTDGEGFSTSTVYDDFGNQVSITRGQYLVSSSDPSYSAAKAVQAFPETTTFTYDADNRLVSQADPLGHVTTYTYDAIGNRLSTTDANGHSTLYAYDLVNRLVQTTTADGGVTRYTYDHFGDRIAQDQQQSGTVTNGVFEHTSYQYDADGRLVEQTDPTGSVTQYFYDAVGNMIAQTSAAGTSEARTVQMVYDLDDRKIADIDALGNQTSYTFDALGNRIEVTDPLGHVTHYDYDRSNQLTQMVDPLGFITTYAYDAAGNRVSVTNGLGQVTTSQYDRDNRLISQTAADGSVTRYTFDAVGNKISSTDALGHTTTYAYDADNRLVTLTDALGAKANYTYDAVGNRLTVTDGNGHTTTYAYDAWNKVIRTTDANGVATTYAYDLAGNQVQMTQAANSAAAATTAYAYDLNNRLVGQTDALGNTQTKAYDAAGNLVSTTDALGHATRYVYDADNRVTSVTDPLGNVTGYRYDANGNRVQVIDARGFVSTSYYNADNQITLSVDNDGYATSFRYDANGNVVSETLYSTPLTLPIDPSIQPTLVASATDRTTSFTYDQLNRLASRTDADGYVTQYLYDAVGNQIETRQALNLTGTLFEVTHSYYDADNRQIASVTAQGYLTTYQYDAVGNLIGQTQYNQAVSLPTNGSVPQPAAGDSGRTTTSVYDADNRLVQQTNALGAVTTYQYDARGNRISMTEAANTAYARTTTYAYDAANRHIETTNALGVVTHLVLDANGNVVTQYDAYGTSQQRVTTYVYDANNRVTSETDPLGSIELTAYDAAGNVVSTTVAAGTAMAETSSSSYDGDNRLTGATDAAGTLTAYTYDAAGNQVKVVQAAGFAEARTNTFVYDGANRLISATDALGTVTQYQYDGAGNKLLTIQAAGTTQQRQTAYTYDLDNRLTQVTDPMDGVTQYQYDAQGNQTRIIDANGGVQVNTFDAMGHALTSLSAAGVLTTNTYDVLGNLLSTTQSFANGSDARITTYAYDALNQQVQVTDGEGSSTSIQYDDFGNQVSVTRAGATTTFAYDADNHLLSMTDALGNVMSYQYDAAGNRTSTTDGNGHTTQDTYDLLNQLIQTTTPEGGITRYTYDRVGDQVSQSQLQSGSAATGVWATTTYQYDANGHKVSQTDPLGTVTQYTYDAMGNMLSQTTAAGTSDSRTVRMEYDLDNRKIADIDALGNRTTYTFDAIGNRIEVTDALGHVAHYYYNGDNRLTEVVDPQGFINTFAYDSAGNRTQTVVYMTPVTGTVGLTTPPTPVSSSLDRITTDQYDRANRPISETAPDGSVTLYSYDGAGNKISETQFANTSAPRTMTFAYDADDRLVSFTDIDGTVTTFTYDAANNKTSETLSSTTDPNHTRTTTYTYDANNRELSETFDPSGLDIVQSATYDHLGNVLSKTDGDGHTTTYTYDLDNRQVSQTDALGNTTTTAYDRIGNKISSTDARDNTTNYVYDADNRLLQQIAPQVQTYTVGVGFSTVRPTITHEYDANGNEIQTTDANGNVTTSYYDGDNRLIAQVNADNALTTYTYDAAGDKTSQTLYMTFLSPGSYSPSMVPTPPAGATEQITYAYDQMGRLTLTTYPPAQITTLVNANTSNPSSVTVTEQVTERYVYDAYGNLVESFDKNGNETLSYYDVKGNRIAKVDAGGYLTEWDYDTQGNVLEQRIYTQPLNIGSLSPSSLPTPPSGAVYVTDIQYDAASRRIKETDPQIATFDPNTQATTQVRPTTTYTYDKAGNQLTKTLGAGTAQAVTEYSYYDADNRLVAAVDSARVLSTYTYDANGNQTAQKRYFNPVSAGVNLAQLSGATNFSALVSASATQDEESDFSYDALNRQTSQSDLLSSGALAKSSSYDADGNKTYTKDEDGYITQASYDGMGRLLESISPDGSGTQYQYDAAGNQILAYTGVLTGGPPTPATNVTASLGSAVKVSWDTVGSAQSPVQTWIVYDTTPHADLSGYANRTTTQVSTNGLGSASFTPPGTGGTVYFRVVTEDGYGNETWTAEQSITIPPSFSAVSVSQPAAGTIVVTASFGAGVTQPQLAYGTSGNLSQSVAFVQQSDGSWQATLTGVSDPAGLSFQLQWQDAAGNSYSSTTSSFAPSADEVGTTSTVSQSQIVNGSSTAYTISVNTQVPSGYASGLTTMEAQWRIAGSGNAFAETAVAGTNSGQGFETYSAVLGGTSNLAPGTYEIVLMGVRADGTSVVLDHFDYVVGATGVTTTRNAVSWIAPPAGSDQLVIIDGQNSPSTSDQGRIVATDGSSDASDDYSVYYGTDVTDSHTVSVTSTAQTTSSPDPSNPTGPPIVTTTGYNVAVQATLGSNEAANIGSGGLHLAWRPAGSGTSFSNDVQLTSTGTNTFGTTLSNLPAGQYDLEVYYVDAQGNTVIVEWQRVDAATVNTQFSGHSLTVQAQESDGTIATNPQGVITVTPGLYTGALNVAALTGSLSLNLVATGNAGGSLQTDGRSTGYFSETQYNSLNYKIASNAGDGLWRTFGVDGNGNEVQTNLLGDQANPNYNPANAITTYTAYDARNNKIASFGAQVEAPDGSGLERAVDRYTYDVSNDVISHTDALGHTTKYVFNALGTQISETDALGDTTQTLVDQFGRTTAQVTQLGHMTLSFYDLQGNLVKQVDPMGNATTYTYDAFGRKLTETDGNNNTTHFAYDQRDRLTSETDALGNTESFVYDGRNNRIKTLYPLGEETDSVYDGLGRVIDTITILGNGQEAQDQKAYDAYGNLISETDAMGRTQTHVYGAFGRLLEDIDQDGNVIAYSYDVYGRKTNAYDPNLVSDPTASSDPSGGKDIQYSYNAAGETTAINDLATGVSTTYTYDLIGHELSDVVTTPGSVANRDTTYEYDALGQLVHWGDSVTGDNLNTQYDAEGNIVREYTDVGYDPLGQNTSGNPNFQYIDHVYTYDADRRVVSEVQRTTDAAGNTSDSIINGYTYDADSNRLTWNNAGTLVTYTYDADDRVTDGVYFTGSDSNEEKWTYDTMGNVLSYITYKDGSQQSSTVNTYNLENDELTSTVLNSSGTQVTTNTYDLTMRITQTVLQNGGKTYTYDYSYYGDGREKGVVAFGDASGNSTITYDADKVEVRVDLGQSDSQTRPEFKTFIADNEGHIIYEFHDDGKSSQNETDQFLYANGNGVGQNTHANDGTYTVDLDTGAYAQVQNLGASNPGINLTYTVQQGDTLQGIASQMYGNPSLWFIIADANGLNGGDALKAGTVLIIPNTIQSGTITADNHTVYSETQITGSTLPNLKTPPPPHHGGCGSILAIIIVVVIAVVAAIATAGLADVILGGAVAAASASSAATVAAFAVAGVAVGAVASVVQQGLFIALGYQQKFSWKDVAASAVAGGFAGAAAGVGQAAEIASKAATASGSTFSLFGLGTTEVKVAVAALDVAKVASQQLIENGKITSWVGLASAAVGGYASAGQSIATGQANGAQDEEDIQAATKAAQASNTIEEVNNYVTPWAQLAETYARHGSLTPSDWATAVGSTLAQAVTQGKENTSRDERLANGALRLGTDALVAGALSLFDKSGAETYIENSVGQEVGQFLGQSAGSWVQSHLPQVDMGSRVFDPQKNAFVDTSTGKVVQLPYGNLDLQPATVSATLEPIPTPPIDTSTALANIGGPSAVLTVGGNPPENYTVVKGDTLSDIIGTSNPAKLGLFMYVNGLTSTNLTPGQQLLVPDFSNFSPDTIAQFGNAGQAALNSDNARVAAYQAKLAQQALDLQQQQQQQQQQQTTEWAKQQADAGNWWVLSTQAQNLVMAAYPGYTPPAMVQYGLQQQQQQPALALTGSTTALTGSTSGGFLSSVSSLYHSATSYVSDQYEAYQEGGFAATDLGQARLAVDNTVTSWGNAIDNKVNQAEQWVDSVRASAPQTATNLANQFSDFVGLDQDSSIRSGLNSVANTGGQMFADYTGVEEGVVKSAYGLVKSTTNIVYSADQLLDPTEWAVNSDANVSRLTTTANTLVTLGKLTNPSIDPVGSAQLYAGIWNSIQTSATSDPYKFGGEALFTGASFFFGAGEVNTANDAVKAAQVADDAANAAKATEVVTDASNVVKDVNEVKSAEAVTDEVAPVAQGVNRTFTNVEDFNRAANAAEPNATYTYNGYTWKTDELGRVSSAEGEVQVAPLNGRAGTDGVSTVSIGKGADAQTGDVGFHLIGDQFGGPTNELNVVPGNGVPANGVANLNQGAYASWESSVKNLALDPANSSVEMSVQPVYYEGNLTTRPDAFNASYRVNGGDWVRTVFRNRPGG